jgi:hypothetical protein
MVQHLSDTTVIVKTVTHNLDTHLDDALGIAVKQGLRRV